MSEILKLAPAFKDYIWGGDILKKEYGANNINRVAEAWVLSCHNDGQSTVQGGSYDGLPLSKALEKMGNCVLGKNAAQFKVFPQLIKLIDAKENLSVQVHPSDEYALENENQYGKTEIWYILNASSGAGIYYGFKEELTPQEFENHIKNNTLTDVLRFVPVKAGEYYFIPSGTIHAIGKGLLIAEIQQNSNATYRIYDYGRIGADGNPRELHIQKAKEVTSLTPAIKNSYGCIKSIPYGTSQNLCSCKYFTVDHIKINGYTNIKNDDSFTAVLIIKGNGEINGIHFKKNNTFFIPAGINAKLKGDFEALLSYI